VFDCSLVAGVRVSQRAHAETLRERRCVIPSRSQGGGAGGRSHDTRRANLAAHLLAAVPIANADSVGTGRILREDLFTAERRVSRWSARDRVANGLEFCPERTVGDEGSSPNLVTSRDGTSVAVWINGTGPPLVLVHGMLSDHTTWRFVVPILGERCTVYAVDRRGRDPSRPLWSATGSAAESIGAGARRLAGPFRIARDPTVPARAAGSSACRYRRPYRQSTSTASSGPASPLRSSAYGSDAE
jgi:hypothetical protein